MKPFALRNYLSLAIILILACTANVFLAQQTYELAPWTNAQFTNSAGVPLANGSVCTYAAGTSTPLVTYANATGTANLACLSLDSSGRASIYLTSSAYKFIVKNSAGSTVRTIDPVQVAGLNAISNFNHTTNTIPKFGGSSTLTTSQITDNGTKVNIGAANSITGTFITAVDGTNITGASTAVNSNAGPTLNLYKSRGTHAAPSTIATADHLFQLSAFAYSGAAFYETSYILIDATGVVTPGTLPDSRMSFITSGAGMHYSGMILDSSGNANFPQNVAIVGTTAHTGLVTASGGLSVPLIGIIAGNPTGSYKGTGTINISGDIYKNNTAYTNPDYVFERYYTGKIDRFHDRPGASIYTGLKSISETEAYTRAHYQLPLVGSTTGMFERSDILLQTVEELYLHTFELNRKITSLESRLQALEARSQNGK